jgi:hypothetical protein
MPIRIFGPLLLMQNIEKNRFFLSSQKNLFFTTENITASDSVAGKVLFLIYGFSIPLKDAFPNDYCLCVIG